MKPALLLIDLQRDFLAAPGLQPAAPALVAAAAAWLQSCRAQNIPVIHIWTTVERTPDRRLPHWRKTNRWQCELGTPGHATPEPLQPLPDELVVHKTGFNPFADGALEKILRAAGCDTVILAGVHLHACVRTAATESLERNFSVHLAESATGSYDALHAAATRRWLAERGVIFETAAAWHGGAPAAPWVHRSPRCAAEILFEVPNASEAEVKRAAATAAAAWPEWRSRPMNDRLKILNDLAARLENSAAEFARQLAVEIGKPVRHAHEEILRAAASIRDVARRAPGLAATVRETAGQVRRMPLGVVGIISAWNNPVAIPLGKIAPALAYGNTVVWKPAPAGAKIAQALMSLLHAAGVPTGAVQLVLGDHVTAQQIAADENVNAVTLTGALAAGQAMQEICARRFVPLQAELSGNNAAIVWDDADLADAAGKIAWGAFAFAGQRCTANRRVIIRAAQFENFFTALEKATARLPWGDPLDAATEIGPLIYPAKVAEQAALVAAAVSDGTAHRVAQPHALADWMAVGNYAPPVIAACDAPASALVQDETMSPLLVVQRADDFEHALSLCNGVRHGLMAALFTGSRPLQEKFLTEARAGVLKFNTATAGVDVSLPFGGWKASGLGPPEHGTGDVQFFTQPQAVYGVME